MYKKVKTKFLELGEIEKGLVSAEGGEVEAKKALWTINLKSNKTTLESAMGRKMRSLGKGKAIICAFPFQGHKRGMTMDSRAI